MKASLWQGVSADLPAEITEGALYFLTDTHEIYFDYDSTHRAQMGGAQSNWTATAGLAQILNKPFDSIVVTTQANILNMIENETYTNGVVYISPEDWGI